MNSLRSIGWQKLPMSLVELNLNFILPSGQSFRWRKSEDDVWTCALHGRILSLRQDNNHLHYHAAFPCNSSSSISTPIKTEDIDQESDNLEKINTETLVLTPPPSSTSSPSTLNRFKGPLEPTFTDTTTFPLIQQYFNLSLSLVALYKHWSTRDSNFASKAPLFTGIRMLRQDAWEALIGFICSSNNNIARISQMAAKLCLHYGPYLGTIDGVPYHDFPSPAALATDSVEAHLRELGFGYRAKYIARTARMIVHEKGGLAWLENHRNPNAGLHGTTAVKPEGRAGYVAAREALLKCSGVGPKVADCVCLMGLGWGEAVPVDTHVWQIAVRDYRFKGGRNATLTAATYAAVAARFRSLWGDEAGWAHSVLFTADLRVNKGVKAEEVKVEIKDEHGVLEDALYPGIEANSVTGGRVAKQSAKQRIKHETASKRKIKLEPRIKEETRESIKLEARVKREAEDEPIDEVDSVADRQGDMMSRIKRRRRRTGVM